MSAKKLSRIALVSMCTLVVLPAAPIMPVAIAHHSLAATFDMNQTITLRGEVVQFLFRNPHSLLQIEVREENGTVHRWAVDWAATFVLDRDGVKRDFLRPGDQVIVVGHPSRNSENRRVRLLTIERPSDGWKWGRHFD